MCAKNKVNTPSPPAVRGCGAALRAVRMARKETEDGKNSRRRLTLRWPGRRAHGTREINARRPLTLRWPGCRAYGTRAINTRRRLTLHWPGCRAYGTRVINTRRRLTLRWPGCPAHGTREINARRPLTLRWPGRRSGARRVGKMSDFWGAFYCAVNEHVRHSQKQSPTLMKQSPMFFK
jgi:hypothetical protein